MTRIAITPNASGTGTFTIAAPNSNTDRTLTLPDAGGEVFSQGNIVGTVSQSAGFPTGAIIQRGSNSNGEFVRFADGTQICTHLITVGTIQTGSGGVFRSSPATWTFPAAFGVTPNGQGGNDPSSNQIWGATRPKSSTEADIVLYSGGAVTSTRSSRVTAIGRWF